MHEGQGTVDMLTLREHLPNGSLRVHLLWVHQTNKPSLYEIRESDLPKDELWVQKLHLVC